MTSDLNQISSKDEQEQEQGQEQRGFYGKMLVDILADLIRSQPPQQPSDNADPDWNLLDYNEFETIKALVEEVDACKLLARVYMRKDGWIRVDQTMRMKYVELASDGGLDRAIQVLVDLCIIDNCIKFKADDIGGDDVVAVVQGVDGKSIDCILSDSWNVRELDGGGESSLRVVMQLLTIDQLKNVEFTSRPSSQKLTKNDRINQLIKQARSQRTLQFKASTSSSAESNNTTTWNLSGSSINRRIVVGEQNNSLEQKLKCRVLKEIGPVIRLTGWGRSLLDRCMLIYNAYTSYEELELGMGLKAQVLVMIQQRKFVQYEIPSRSDPSMQLFQSRWHLCNYLKSLQLYHVALQMFDQKQYDAITGRYESLLQYHDDLQGKASQQQVTCLNEQYDPAAVMAKVLFVVSQAMGKLKWYDREMDLLQMLLCTTKLKVSKRGTAWERLLLLAERYVGPSGAEHRSTRCKSVLFLGKMALADPSLVRSKRRAVLDRIMRVEKSLKCDTSIITLQQDVGVLLEDVIFPTDQIVGKRFVGVNIVIKSGGFMGKSRWHGEYRDLELVSETELDTVMKEQQCGVYVEQLALEHYQRLGWQGLVCEGGPLKMIYALLFVDTIFMGGVRGAFMNPYQLCSLDFGTELFYHQRKAAIDALLLKIENEFEAAVEQMQLAYQTYNGCMIVGVNWDHKIELLTDIAHCLGGERLSLFCKHLPMHLSGLPDLLLYKPAVKQICLVEVKGPGDSLMDNQTLWLEHLLKIGIPFKICKVVTAQ